MISNFAAWVLVAASVVAEVVGTVALKYSNGFSNAYPSSAAAACYTLAIWLMAVAMKRLEMGVTYAVWGGSGISLTALVGVYFFNEEWNPVKLFGLAFVVAGVVMLNLSSQQ